MKGKGFPGGKALSRRYRRRRRHKSAEGKTFWARSCRSVCPRVNARMCKYMYTYVYVVLSDGTRGCCGLIYRLSLPWKPRRDRLARHPHIRVDSGLLYSPPSLARFCSHPPSIPLYLLLVLALLRPHLLTPFAHCFSSSSSLRQALSYLIFSSLFLHGTHDLCPSSSHTTPNSMPLSLCLLSVRLLASPNESSSILSSFHSSVELFHLVFAFSTLTFYLTILFLVHAVSP